jgi:type II secretory pathway pseudopilin PulG
MKNRIRAQDGATFIEVVAAVSVFAMVTVGLSPALLNARKAADFGKNQSIATTLAQDKIEQIRGSGLGACTNDATLQPNGTSGGIFSRTCTSTANTPISGVYRVVVSVSWRDRPATSSVSLVALVRI